MRVASNLKFKPFIQAPCPVIPFHMDTHRFSGFLGLILDVCEDKMSYALISVLRKNGNVDYSNIRGTFIHIKPTHRNPVQKYYEKISMNILVLVIDMLSLKLLIQEGLFLLFGPLNHQGHFAFPGACINILKQRHVSIGDRTKV